MLIENSATHIHICILRLISGSDGFHLTHCDTHFISFSFWYVRLELLTLRDGQRGIGCAELKRSYLLHIFHMKDEGVDVSFLWLPSPQVYTLEEGYEVEGLSRRRFIVCRGIGEGEAVADDHDPSEFPLL